MGYLVPCEESMSIHRWAALLLLAACDGSKPDDTDADGDGYTAADDCDDADAAIHPDADESCDGVDQDCDGAVDDAPTDAPTWYGDDDGDGFGGPVTSTGCEAPAGFVADGTDCDDGDAATYPGAPESCIDPVDRDCDGSGGLVDADGDGSPACEDCDDTNANVLPHGTEACDGADDDCDGEVDEAGATGESTWYADADGDGYGDPSAALDACDIPNGYVADSTDCDDTADTTNPGAAEVCDGAADEDCDGLVDDADPSVTGTATWYLDLDGDGHAGGDVTTAACTAPSGYLATSEDCDDADAAIHPGATEVCDSADKDEDCDALADDADPDATGQSVWYADADGDGYGSTSTVAACDLPASYADAADDCDDADATINPGAAEVCDAADVDEDCDGLADDADPDATGQSAWYADDDGDGQGNPAIARSACDDSGVWVASGTDCDDGDPAVYLGATETPGDGIDADCDGADLCYADADDDGYRPDTTATAVGTLDCSGSGEALATDPAGDCDDADATISPVGTEVCNLADDDCDGAIDEGVASTFYVDADGDGYGSDASTTTGCSAPAGYAATADDCDDTDAALNPGATDVCGDGVDQDCDDDAQDCTFTGEYDSDSYTLRYTGDGAEDYFGRAIATGDFDGDGNDDLAVGVEGYYEWTGGAAVWYGPLTTSGTYTDGSAAFLATGATYYRYSGYAMGASDHDGDGIDDLVVGSLGDDATYILYGGSTRRSGTSETLIGASASATFTGEANSDAGTSVGGGGDLDGDGYEEIAVGASLADGGGTNAGAVYLLYGQAADRAADTAASADATLQGGAGDGVGGSVAIVPDMDGDGLDELFVGSASEDTIATNAGAARLFLGDAARFSGTVVSAGADATWSGTSAEDALGTHVYPLTDLDGDGYGDAGVYGRRSGGTLFLYLGGPSLPASATAQLVGGAGDSLGSSAYSPGDMDGDGVNDLLVGASGTNGAYLFFGPIDGTIGAADVDVAFLGPTHSAYPRLGDGAPTEPADLTGDGLTDIVVGASWDSVPGAGYNSGSVYVWAGRGGE